MQTLRLGDQGTLVQYLQQALNRATGEVLDIDGIFGRRTEAQVRRVQGWNALAQDGIVGPRTWAALFPMLSGYTVYTIRPGDTMWLIAQRFRANLDDILQANPNANPNNLQIGQRIIVPYPFPIVTDSVLPSALWTQWVLDGLLARYPFLEAAQGGDSVMGKEIPMLTLGKGETELFFSASHHGNESITTPLVLMFLENYCRAIARNENIGGMSAEELYNRTKLHIAPLVNPDGVDLVNGMIPQDDSYYGQAQALASYYPSIPFPQGWKANIRGVDLNLQYPARWEEAREIKFAQGYTRPGPRDFVGTAPLSEPESQFVARYTLSYDMRLIIALHTQGEVIFWKFQDYEVPRAAEIAAAMQAASGYIAEDTPYASGNAGYKDWFIQDFRLPGFTVEAGRGENPLPMQDLYGIYERCEPIFTIALNMA